MNSEYSSRVQLLTDERKLGGVTVNWCLFGFKNWQGTIESEEIAIPHLSSNFRIFVEIGQTIVDIWMQDSARKEEIFDTLPTVYLVHRDKTPLQIHQNSRYNRNYRCCRFRLSGGEVTELIGKGNFTISCYITVGHRSRDNDEQSNLMGDISAKYLASNLLTSLKKSPEEVTLISKDGFKVSTDRFVLCALSKRFSPLLTNEQREMVVKDCDAESLTAIVGFLDGRGIANIDSVAKKLLLVPHDIEELRRICEDHVLRTVTPATVNEVFSLGAEVGSARIKSGCLDLMIFDEQYASLQNHLCHTFATDPQIVDECLRTFEQCPSLLMMTERIAFPRNLLDIRSPRELAERTLFVTRRLRCHTSSLTWIVNDFTWKDGEYFESKLTEIPQASGSHCSTSLRTNVRIGRMYVEFGIAFNPPSVPIEKVELFIRDSDNSLHTLTPHGFKAYTKASIESDQLEEFWGKRSLTFIIQLTLPGKLQHRQLRPDYLEKTSAEQVRVDSILKYLATTPRDITLTGTDGFSVKAHRSILMASSSAFRAMLEAKEWLESKEKRIVVKDCDNETLDAMVKFIHGEHVENWQSMTHKLIVIADKYDITSLRLCESCLIQSLSVQNALDALIVADQINSLELKNECLEFMCSASFDYAARKKITDALTDKPDLLREFLNFFVNSLKVQLAT